MHDNEFKALEQLNDIDDDLIAGAEKSPKRFNTALVAGIAAAVVVSVIALAVINPFKKPETPKNSANNDNKVTEIGKIETNTPALPTTEPVDNGQNPAVNEQPEDKIQKKILYASGNEHAANEYIPARGGKNIATPLSFEIEKEENKDCLFAVGISLYHISDELYKELLNKERLLYQNSISEYDRMFDEWQKQITSNDPRFTEGKSIDEYPENVHAFGWPEYYGYTPEEFWSRGSNYLYVGLVIMYNDFNNYLKDKMPEAEYNELMAAHKEYLELIDELDGSQTMIRELTKNVHMDEVERLKALGLDVKLEEREDGWTSITGVLTPEQISDFPASSKYSYLIIWQGHDNAINE